LLVQCALPWLISGFTNTNTGCCGVGRNNGQITCLPLQAPCRNRNQYVFWDAFHPTEAVNVIIGRRSYSAQSASDAYPYDIRQLAQQWRRSWWLWWDDQLKIISPRIFISVYYIMFVAFNVVVHCSIYGQFLSVNKLRFRVLSTYWI